MKIKIKLLIIITLIAGSAVPSFANFSFVQGCKGPGGTTGGATTITATCSPFVAGNVVVCTTANDGSGPTTLSTIAIGATGGTIVDQVNSGENVATAVIFGYASSQTVVTATFSGPAADRSISCIEFSGQSSGSPVDGTNHGGRSVTNPGTGTDALTADVTGWTPGGANYLFYCSTTRTDNYGTGTNTQGTNFTKPAATEQNVNAQILQASEYWIQTSATLSKCPWTEAQGAAAVYIDMAVVLKVDGGAAAASEASKKKKLSAFGVQ